MSPRFAAEAAGCRITDAAGKDYIDYIGAYGPLILGHSHPKVVESVRAAASRGLAFGMPTAIETEMAKAVVALVPTVEKVRMVNSGTEATLSAVRLARAATGKERIVKFEGCYHGHGDSFLIKAGSGALTLGLPDSPGVPAALAALTLVARFNDLDSVERLFAQEPDSIAAVIVEPVAGNMGVVPPASGFLEGLRELTRRHGSLLIFDEVMTGFRLAAGGAQEVYGVDPDITTLGKVIGGGLPVGAYGGGAALMDRIAPAGPVYQAGTLSGNPLAMAAGLAQLGVLREANGWTRLEERSARLERGVGEILAEAGIPASLNRVGSMLTLFFTEEPVTDFASAIRSDTKRHAQFFRAMLENGVHLPPSQFEAWFVSLAHDEDAIDRTLEAVRKSLPAASS